MFGRILIANRGEIAVRILRACRSMDVEAVVAYSEADRESRAVQMAAAILMHLADLHPKAGLAPRCGSMERAQLNRGMSYFAMHVYEGENRRAHPENYTSDPSGARGIAEAAAISVNHRYDLFEPELGHGPYFLDDHFTILDIYIWVLVQWRPDYDEMRRDHPKTLRLVEAVMERPKIKPLHDAQFVPGLGNS